MLDLDTKVQYDPLWNATGTSGATKYFKLQMICAAPWNFSLKWHWLHFF